MIVHNETKSCSFLIVCNLKTELKHQFIEYKVSTKNTFHVRALDTITDINTFPGRVILILYEGLVR